MEQPEGPHKSVAQKCGQIKRTAFQVRSLATELVRMRERMGEMRSVKLVAPRLEAPPICIERHFCIGGPTIVRGAKLWAQCLCCFALLGHIGPHTATGRLCFSAALPHLRSGRCLWLSLLLLLFFDLQMGLQFHSIPPIRHSSSNSIQSIANSSTSNVETFPFLPPAFPLPLVHWSTGPLVHKQQATTNSISISISIGQASIRPMQTSLLFPIVCSSILSN